MAGRLAAFTEHTALFRCPLCGGKISHSLSSLRCENGHDFSLSRKGYCDFASDKHAALYTKSLFESRRRIMESRLYAPFREKLASLLHAYAPEGPLLDAGTGEGTFLKSVSDGRLSYGADLAREGIALAASGGNGLGWMIADLSNLPFQSGSVGTILNILSPASYPEFTRVLQENGLLLKVIPGDLYLGEIRVLTGKGMHSSSSVQDLFMNRFSLIKTDEVCTTFKLTEEEAVDLFRMTPLTEHASADTDTIGSLKTATIHLIFLLGTRKA